jgi:hypothetical protein
MIKKLIKTEKYSWVDSQMWRDSGITFKIETEFQYKRIWIFKFAERGRTKITLMDLDQIILEEIFPKAARFISNPNPDEGSIQCCYLIGNLLVDPEDYIYSKLYSHDRH